jgi:type IV pilus assembly protein PilC
MSKPLALYRYEALDKNGKLITGEINAASLIAAKTTLIKQGMTPKKVTKHSNSLLKFSQRISAADICSFSRQMATMISAGVPLVQSFEITLKGLENPTMTKLISAIKQSVEAGRSLSEALAQHPRYFDDLYCSLVASGENSGSLEEMLNRIALYKEKSESIKKKIKKALFYPTAVILVAIIVTAILLIKVVPQFETMFAEFGSELPAFTQFVVNLSKSVQSTWYLYLAVGVGTVFGIKRLQQTSKKFKHGVDRMMLKLPVVGKILEKACIARFARTLSTTFAAGVPLVEALDSVAGACGNQLFADATLRIKEEVTTGTQMQIAMRNTNVFPNMVVQLTAIGEEAGSLDAMLAKVADIYEEEVDLAIDSLSSLLEPMIMAFLGVVVGGLVVAMYLPIFKMGAVV